MGSPTNVQRLPTSDVDIADGLQSLANDVRAGKIGARRCFVVFETPHGDGGALAGTFFGVPAPALHIVGMLEFAKFQLIAEHR